MNTPETNQQVVVQYVQAFNNGDSEALRKLFTHDAVISGVLGWAEIERAVPVWRELHAAFAIELTIDEMIAGCDIVAVRYTERGKSVGSFRGGAVTGKTYELVAMEWFHFRDGKIARRWGARDSAAQNRQMAL